MAQRFAQPQGKPTALDNAHVVQLVTPIRPELHKAMRLKAAEEGTTMRVLVMRGLHAIGLPVVADDEQDRRSARGNRRPYGSPGQPSAQRKSV